MKQTLLNLLRIPYRALKTHYRQSRLRGPRAMAAFARHFPQASFVQIGSNDGDKHDPLRRALLGSQWTGVMVEPVPYVFARLQQNYGGNSRVRLENVAIATRGGTLPFYHLAQAMVGETLPSWYDELGSFRKDVVLKHVDRIPDIEKRLVTVQVPCVTFAELCCRNSISAPDLIHIDTEGYDYEIIKTFDFTTTRPILLVYEHKHLGEAMRQECAGKLRSAGYALFEEGQDSWCLDEQPRDDRHRALLRDWVRIAGRSTHS